MGPREQVLAAADALVAAFAGNDRAAYFGAFSADATFVFHNLAAPLLSRAAYQALWDQWRAEDGFEVLNCASSNREVSLQGELAIFIHDVHTTLCLQGETLSSQERETIVFRLQQDGHWLACHEHLSCCTLPSL